MLALRPKPQALAEGFVLGLFGGEMPLYEYRCVCGNEREAMCPFGTPQTCECGKDMERIWSVPRPAVMKQTGNDMALDSLNSKQTSHVSPEHKKAAERGLR